jgi:hypothetical protein
MPKHLYMFTYQTPGQVQFGENSFAEESSAAVFIEADSAEQAAVWGQEISERFVSHLFGGKEISWRGLGFESWIEADPKKEFPLAVLEQVPVVTCGALPDFNQLQG